MRRIAIINQKGGVGKTTTVANIAAALARAGQRVLVCDLDPQAHLTLHFGLDPSDDTPDMYDLLTGSASIAKARVKVGHNLWVVGASIDLAAAEVELVSIVGREVVLQGLLDQHVGDQKDTPFSKYDYILFDCPPSMGVLTLNGLCGADEVIIPLQPHYLALQGLGKLLETVQLVSRRIHSVLRVSGVAICMNDAGTRLAAEVVEDVRRFLADARGTAVPWSKARLYESMIRRNIKLAEAPSYGQSIFDYAPESNGATDYERLAQEIHASSCDQAASQEISASDDAASSETASVENASVENASVESASSNTASGRPHHTDPLAQVIPLPVSATASEHASTSQERREISAPSHSADRTG